MNIQNIALSGGALKGLAYAGCFQALEEYGIVKNIKRLSGTSIGAMFGYALLLGYTSSQLQEIICKVNYNFLRDINIDNILSFHNSFGFDTGNNIEKAIRVITEKQGFSPDITFEQFHRITGVEFIVVTTCVSKKKKVAFSYKTHPDFSVVKAVRISCGLPFLFNRINIDGDDYVDGCLMENTPISYFKDDIENTMAFMLNTKSIPYDHTLSSYAYNVISCMTETISKLQLDKYYDYVLDLNNIIMSSYIELTENERIEIIKYGYNETSQYLEKRMKKYNNNSENKINDSQDSIQSDIQSDVQSDVQSENTIERKKKEFSKLTEQINDILNYKL